MPDDQNANKNEFFRQIPSWVIAVCVFLTLIGVGATQIFKIGKQYGELEIHYKTLQSNMMRLEDRVNDLDESIKYMKTIVERETRPNDRILRHQTK